VVVPLGGLVRDESRDLLQRLAAHLTTLEADAVADVLGDLPLALHLAGSYLARVQGHETAAQYLTRLAAVNVLDHPAFNGRALRAGEDLPTRHAQEVARTFALSLEQLDPAQLIDMGYKSYLTKMLRCPT
jgi:hypothetical protein